MNAQRIPLFTLCLLATVMALYWLAPDPAWLYFSRADILRGEPWRLVSGHFMHADLNHLWWNGLGLLVLGTLIELRSKALWWASLAGGVLAVSLLLLSPLARLDNYCGLSGVLNALLVVAIWLEWQATRSRLVVLIAAACVAKVAIEIVLGDSVVSDISWPPYAWSHLAGLLGGALVAGAHSLWRPNGGEWFDKRRGVDQYSGRERQPGRTDDSHRERPDQQPGLPGLQVQFQYRAGGVSARHAR